MFPLRDENPTERVPVVTVVIIAFNVLVWLLVLSTLVSMGQRLMFSRLPEHLPSGPAEK